MRAVLVVFVVLLGIMTVSPAQAADHTVTMSGSQYQPQQVTIDLGDRVRWVNNESTRHSVTSDDRDFDSSPDCSAASLDQCMGQGDSFIVTFNGAGTFRYFCKIHGAATGVGMSGTVTVRGAPTTTVPATVTTAPPPTTTTTAVATTTSSVTSTSTTTTEPPTTTTETTTTTIATTSTTEEDLGSAAAVDADDGRGTGWLLLLLLAIVLVGGVGGALVWRLRPDQPGREGEPPPGSSASG